MLKIYFPLIKKISIYNHAIYFKLHYFFIFFNIFIFIFFFDISNNFLNIILTSIILVLLGALDDAIEIGVTFRLLTQLICCLILIGSGLQITNIGDYMYLPNIEIGYFSVVFTVFCVIGLTNSFNFIDGVDGLCAGLALIAILSIMFVSNFNDKIIFLIDLKILLILSLTLIFFIILNVTNFFKIFLGDSGSMFLGFLVAWILISTSQNENQIMHPVLTIWCVSLPVLDITSVVIRRMLRGTNPFKPDRRHVHHILIEIGFSNFISTLIILTLAVIINCIGFLIYYLSGPFPALISFILLLFIYVILMIHLSRIANSK